MADVSLHSELTLVAGNFHAWTAPVGTPFPADIGTAVGDGIDDTYVDLGYTGQEGAAFKVETTTKDLYAHQAFDPLRTVLSARKATIELPILEWSEASLILAFGGGAVTSTSNGFEYTPPLPGVVEERSMVCDIVDGDRRVRIAAERGLVAGSVNAALKKDDWGIIPIVFTVLAPVDQATGWVLLGTDFGSTGS